MSAEIVLMSSDNMDKLYFSRTKGKYYTYPQKCDDCKSDLESLAFVFKTVLVRHEKRTFICKILCKADLAKQTKKYITTGIASYQLVIITNLIPTDSFEVIPVAPEWEYGSSS